MQTLKCYLLMVWILLSVTAFAIPPAPRARIVAKVALKGQTADTPTTALFTPKSDGLFQITIYMVNTVAFPSSGAAWGAQVNGIDDSGPWSDSGYWGVPVSSVTNSLACCFVTQTISVRNNTGTPITYSVTGFGNPPAGSTYEIFIVVEQLM